MEEFQTVCEYYLNPERAILFGTEIYRAMDEFSVSPGPFPPAALSYFADWFLFDFAFAGGEPPIRRFPKANPRNLSPEELLPFGELADNNRFDFFRISALTKHDMIFESVRSGERFEVVRAGMRAGEDDVAVCRIGRAGGKWEVLTPAPIAMSAPSKPDIKRMKTHFPILNSRIVFHEIVAGGYVDDSP